MARHYVTFYLEGGSEVGLEVEDLEVQVSEDGNIVGYTMKNVPEERISYFYLKPGAINGIVAQLTLADEEESDSE